MVTCTHPLEYSFAHVCTYAGLGTRERDFFIQQALTEQLNCVRHSGVEDCNETDFLKYRRCHIFEWLKQGGVIYL